MAEELAFVLINPYTITKSRTGGVIARYMSRTGLNFAGARMFAPCRELVERYSEQIRHANPKEADLCNLIANYVLTSYAPELMSGRTQRVMMLLFTGDGAIDKIKAVTGSATLRQGHGETIRETYGDYITDDDGRVRHFEPAVLVPPTRKRARETLRLWAEYSETDGGVIKGAADVAVGEDVERTLVLLKPDNFRMPSLRPGSIIDVLSASGLRIVGAKKVRMSVAQAEEFYGPVRELLSEKFTSIGCERVRELMKREFDFEIPPETAADLCRQVGPFFAAAQFEQIVQFMTGFRPSECAESAKRTTGREECLALVYEGTDAVSKIREVLGTTDPSKARPGSVRREFGSNIMVNAAHASDSVESAAREMGIINIEDDSIRNLVEKYYGPIKRRTSKSSSKGAMQRVRSMFRKILGR